MTLGKTPAARFEISIDGIPRTNRDQKDLALLAAQILKSRNPNSVVVRLMQAADRQKAAEAQKLVDELGECFPYLDRKLAEAARALIAINDGVQKLHQAGFPFPTDAQVRLAVATIVQSWAHGIPKSWHQEMRDGLRFLAPNERQTAVGYWDAIEPSLNNSIRQHAGEGEETKKRRVGENEKAA